MSDTETDDGVFKISMSECSDWSCYLFGGYGTGGIIWTPDKGKEPNWFWRWMQYACFGNRWVKHTN